MKDGICPKCSGRRILGNLNMIDRGESNAHHLDSQIAVRRAPDAWIFKGTEMSPIRAWVCEACGYTEFYVLAPSILGHAIDCMAPVDMSRRKELPYRVQPKAD